MKTTQKIHLVIIDPQNDFMDRVDGIVGFIPALPVPGATADMQRLAAFIAGNGEKLEDIHVTMDSHQVIDISHPMWWKDAKGNPPPPFTQIIADDVEAGIWTTRDPGVRTRSLQYLRTLEQNKKKRHTVWTEHCIIGTPGHAIQADLMKALLDWQRNEYAMLDVVTKGTNPYTEHYGGLMAEVEDPTDPTTLLNTKLLETLEKADVVLVAGEALSHCVMETVNQIIDNIGTQHLSKIHIMTDCSSSIAAIPNVIDFPALTAAWIKDIQKKGVQLTTSTTFFN